MKKHSILRPMCLAVSLMLLFSASSSNAQVTHLYGTNADNNFSKVIPDGQDYYVLGQENFQATITRILSTGVIDWTQRLNMSSSLLDGIIMPNGHLLVVGLTTPFPNQSIIGEIDRNKNWICLNTFESPGNEGIVSIDAINATTYLAVGFHASNTPKDIVIYKISTATPGCAILQKYQFDNFTAANYGNDIVVTGPNSFMVCGTDASNGGVLYQYDLIAGQQGGVIDAPGYEYVDMEPAGGDILVAINSLSGGRPHIVRFDASLLPMWETEIFGLSSVSQILIDANDKIYVVGTANTISRRVVLKLDDCIGTCPPSSDWPGNKARYLDNGSSSHSEGFLAVANSGMLAFVDGRVGPGGLGMEDGFLAITDADMTSTACMMEHQIDLNELSTFFASPEGDSLFFYDSPSPVAAGADLQMWDKKETCGNETVDSCVCSMPELNLFQNGMEYALSCLPHGGATTVVGCPTGTVSIGGFFGCMDSITGEPCSTETAVTYILTGPNGGTPIDGGTTTNYTQFLFPSSYFQTSGTYKLTLSTLCPGQQDSCVCMLDWIVECDPCCQDSLAFITAAQNVQASGQLGELCDISYTTDGLTDCTEITFDWGDGQSTGPLVGGSVSVSHAYISGGVYNVCYTVYEINNIDTCWTYTHCDSVEIVCDTCLCGDLIWADVWGINQIPTPIACGDTVIISNNQWGPNLIVHGDFTCIPDACGNDNVFWDLDRPVGLPNTFDLSTSPYPHFDIIIPWADIQQSGYYTLSMTRNCGTKECKCSFTFYVPVKPCACPIGEDIRKGFSVAGTKTSCTRKVMPIQLCPNDIVSWKINGPGIPNQTYGPTTGNNPLTIAFPAPGGSYSVCMFVTRYDPITEDTCYGEFCRNIIVKCNVFPNDTNPSITTCPGGDRLLNGDFTEGLIAGHLGKGGAVTDWSLFPNDGDGIVFVEDSTGASDDGYIVLIGGKDNFAGIFQEVNLTGDSLYIGFYAINYLGSDLPAGTALELRLQSEPIQGINQWIWRFVMDTSYISWVDTSIVLPIDIDPSLRYLVVCVQNDDETMKSVVGIDNIEICTDETVGISDPGRVQEIRIYPNPNTGEFTVDFLEPAPIGTSIRIINLAGQVVSEREIENANSALQVDATMLPQGMYFLQVLSKGQVIAVNKFVKQ